MNGVRNLFNILSTLMAALRAVMKRSVRAELETEIRDKLDSEALAKADAAFKARRRARKRLGFPDGLRASDPFERN